MIEKNDLLAIMVAYNQTILRNQLRSPFSLLADIIVSRNLNNEEILAVLFVKQHLRLCPNVRPMLRDHFRGRCCSSWSHQASNRPASQ